MMDGQSRVALDALKRQIDKLRRKPDWISTNDEVELDSSVATLETRIAALTSGTTRVDEEWRVGISKALGLDGGDRSASMPLPVLAQKVTALTAERDEMRPAWDRLVAIATRQGRSVGGVLDDADAIRERVEAAERTASAYARFCAETLGDEAAGTAEDAVKLGRLLRESRERVKALEAEVTSYREHEAAMAASLREARAAESRLAAIRQRAGDREALGRATWEAIRRDNPKRPEYPDWEDKSEPLREEARRRGEWVARYILGDDAPPSEMAGLEGEMSEKPEPTTAEAFAFCRTVLAKERGSSTPNPHALAMIALLERRMGAQQAPIQAAPHGLARCATYGVCECWKASALADAPPVFTLEEVEKALRSEGVDDISADIIRKRLAALRKG